MASSAKASASQTRSSVDHGGQRTAARLEDQARLAECAIGEPVPGTSMPSPARGGSALDGPTRTFMERRLRHNFADVRVHADAPSAAAARDLRAKAFTVGKDVSFGAGQFAPHTLRGARLLAHELQHVAQQRTMSGPPVLQAKSDDEEIDSALAAKHADNPAVLDPSHSEYANTLQAYGSTLTRDEHYALLKKPTAPAEVAAWQAKFRKAGLLAARILASGPAVDNKEMRAGQIAIDLAEAGFVDSAMKLAAQFSDPERVKIIYAGALTHPATMTAAHATTITRFFSGRSATLVAHPVMMLIRDRTGDYSKALQTEKLKAILTEIVAKYEKDPAFVEAMSEVLIFAKWFRASFSAMMSGLGKGDLMFAILRSPYFADEDQADRLQFEDKSGTAVALDRETDQQWVVAEKQKYYVDYLIRIAAAQQVTIAKPANMTFTALRTWLDTNTSNIGTALKAGPASAAVQVYREIADIFFYHVTQAEGDVRPDSGGRLTALQPGTPQRLRMKSDCDVLASYAMRLLTASGMQPVSYMGIIPADATRQAHAMALMLQGGTYYAISNKTIEPLADVKTEAEAEVAVVEYGLHEAYGTPLPSAYRIFVGRAGVRGELPMGVVDQDATLRRKDLEPASAGAATP